MSKPNNYNIPKKIYNGDYERCMVCYEDFNKKNPNILMEDCGHAGICEICVKKCDKCPYCRKNITKAKYLKCNKSQSGKKLILHENNNVILPKHTYNYEHICYEILRESIRSLSRPTNPLFEYSSGIGDLVRYLSRTTPELERDNRTSNFEIKMPPKNWSPEDDIF